MDEQLEELVRRISSLLQKMVYFIPIIGEEGEREIIVNSEAIREHAPDLRELLKKYLEYFALGSEGFLDHFTDDNICRLSIILAECDSIPIIVHIKIKELPNIYEVFKKAGLVSDN